MNPARTCLLAASTSPWLRERATRSPHVRRAVSRFMPGERLGDALRVALELEKSGVKPILSYLGENLSRAEDTELVVVRYLEAIDEGAARGLDAQISVKPTQLGLDIDPALAAANLRRLVDRAKTKGAVVWIDMESSSYVDLTLDLFRQARRSSACVGVALQAYLYRTPKDLESLLPLAPMIRIVKGAYLEPASLAFPRKGDVDRQFVRLATRVLGAEARAMGARMHVATHDAVIVDRLEAWASEQQVPPGVYEYAMLYGIQRRLQARLASAGRPLRVLISYGENWFPWYMRRLAERPANVWFALKGGWL